MASEQFNGHREAIGQFIKNMMEDRGTAARDPAYHLQNRCRQDGGRFSGGAPFCGRHSMLG